MPINRYKPTTSKQIDDKKAKDIFVLYTRILIGTISVILFLLSAICFAHSALTGGFIYATIGAIFAVMGGITEGQIPRDPQ